MTSLIRSMADSVKSLKILWSMADNVMSAMLRQTFNDFIHSFNRNISFSRTNNFPKSFNFVFDATLF